MRYRVINPNGDGSIRYAPQAVHDQILEAGGLRALGRTFLESEDTFEAAAVKFQAVLDTYTVAKRGAVVDDIPTQAIAGYLAGGKIVLHVEKTPAPPPSPPPGVPSAPAPSDDGGLD